MTTETLTVAGTLTSSVAPRATKFTDTVASEWVKLTTLRSTYLTLGLGVVLSVVMSALVSAAVGSTFDSWSASRQAQFQPILLSVSGNVVVLIAFAVFGVLVAAGEYSSGMIRLTLTATPSRGRVFLAKLLLVGGLTMVLGVVSLVAMFLVGQAVLGAYGIPVASLGDADARRLVLGLGLVTPLFPILGLALGVILRSTAGAITVILGMMWLPQLLGTLLPTWPQEHVLSLLPGLAADSMTVAHIAHSPMYSDAGLGAAMVALWLVAFVGTAYVMFRRRDA